MLPAQALQGIAAALFALALVLVFARYPPVFIGLLLFFLGFTTAYQQYQTVHPLWMLLAALPPTLVAIIGFRFL